MYHKYISSSYHLLMCALCTLCYAKHYLHFLVFLIIILEKLGHPRVTLLFSGRQTVGSHSNKGENCIRSHNTRCCLIEVVTKAGLTVSTFLLVHHIHKNMCTSKKITPFSNRFCHYHIPHVGKTLYITFR